MPGTVGAICLVLAMYAFQVLPVNYAGLGLMLLGIGLMIAEVFTPSFGILGIGGGVAFVIGSLMLMDTESVPGFGIDPALITAFGLTSLILFVAVLGFALKARNRPVVTGREEMLGATGIALADFTGAGKIRIHGEIWDAYSETPVAEGERVCVKQLEGLTLRVEPQWTRSEQ